MGRDKPGDSTYILSRRGAVPINSPYQSQGIFSL
jgi:hypothetical protein